MKTLRHSHMPLKGQARKRGRDVRTPRADIWEELYMHTGRASSTCINPYINLRGGTVIITLKMRKLRRGEVASLAPGLMAVSKRGSGDLVQAVGVRATLRTTLPHGLTPPPGAPQHLRKKRNTRTTFALPSCAGLTNGL